MVIIMKKQEEKLNVKRKENFINKWIYIHYTNAHTNKNIIIKKGGRDERKISKSNNKFKDDGIFFENVTNYIGQIFVYYK